uniref:Uncharacterized protein n=1 Tax=Siphoviridae sp. ctEP635 TaxID=2825396 RepID=A0A8S5UWW6_9CAUD|nr:MAG TPA: hypothetical protein [Siphoviridae sp. ctEP635]
MQIENIKISPAEVNNFPTALKWRRHAFGMDYEDVAELVGGGLPATSRNASCAPRLAGRRGECCH